MSPRATSSGDTPEDVPVEEAPVEEAPVEEAPVENPNPDIQAMNVAMEATQPDESFATTSDPPGSDVPTAENVRRYPHLFDDATRERFGGDELPLSDVERAQAEQAEAEQAEADQAEGDNGVTNEGTTDVGETSTP